MPVKKKATTNDNPESTIQVLKEAQCSTLSGTDETQLTYQILSDQAGEIYLKVTGNKGGGFWASENTPYTAIADLLRDADSESGFSAWTLLPLFSGKSSNSPGYLLSLLRKENLVEPLPGKRRLHRACDPAPFLAQIIELSGGSSAKGRPQTKAKAKTKAKAPAKRPSTRKKSPARSKKAS
jgi:hypothetical protein